ncbi:MAG: methylenetetrahydrofolate reductase [Proteobacteria bacterium]|nr:MAG: methylenetetrahydrofolate reductase [Pseudomonadota bacterium]
MTALAAQDEAPSDPLARIAAFMKGFSIEATRPSDADIAALAPLKRCACVYLSAVPNRPADESLGAAIRLRAAGFEPVPHVAVRNFADLAALDDFLARLNGEAGVTHVLVIAGDRAESGSLRRALDAIDSGTFRRRGIRTIGIAGYPEGHPRIGGVELNRALGEKIAVAEATGLAVEIVTQFCFNASAILNFLARLRAFGFEHPVRIGLAGPTSLAALLRYAARCGVRTSAQALVQRSGLVRQMFAMTTPDDLVQALADVASAGVTPHFFSFGGVRATARWARAVADGSIALKAHGGFLVEAPKSEG